MYALVIGALLTVFAVISWQVAVAGPLLAADLAVRDAAAGPASGNGTLQALAEAGADLGGGGAAGAVLAVGASAAARRARSWRPLLLAALAVVAVPAVVLPLKEAFGRLGPDGLPLYGYAGYYPSGHTLTAVVAYGTTALLCAHRFPVAGPVAATLLSLCTGLGLVLRGYHWATDVVASVALGGIVLCLLAALPGRTPRGAGPGSSRPAPPGTRAAPGPEQAGRGAVNGR